MSGGPQEQVGPIAAPAEQPPAEQPPAEQPPATEAEGPSNGASSADRDNSSSTLDAEPIRRPKKRNSDDGELACLAGGLGQSCGPDEERPTPNPGIMTNNQRESHRMYTILQERNNNLAFPVCPEPNFWDYHENPRISSQWSRQVSAAQAEEREYKLWKYGKGKAPVRAWRKLSWDELVNWDFEELLGLSNADTRIFEAGPENGTDAAESSSVNEGRWAGAWDPPDPWARACMTGDHEIRHRDMIDEVLV